ncbi:hypothetical protein ACT3XG_18305 [Paenibacillus polymyxa]|jgi:hypothetical protein|uniref:Uncharacterized protein n=1 Tax=Paenibacillus polymyxa TaxID=1406 RepID=A0A378Y265_PAEPO|nr:MULTISPECIES: hypothetical protein [Paenibacillus]AHM67389.1 hypothetical protein PPSQR21_037510 [Paenibacillus polymyxa SQR-21]AUS28008.1 hypothetical protein C1A50_3844 [Paenibacillus polymyxa]KAF6586124.1 hypothetical protein G9G57_05395 [Paenibacillus sp. EKM211P]KAF6615582.1 hypothetical protein HFE00_19825 [Paenibacillus sp. EKM101P]KAF6619948.1 hypothetical protein HFE03_18230 [Paenibacillus sp. EKM102P]
MDIRRCIEKNFRLFIGLLGVSKAPPTTDDGVIVPPPAPGVNRLSVPLNKEE